MIKRTLLLLLLLLSTMPLLSSANPKKEITMLVVPRDANAIAIAQDISCRYPILLVSYQQIDHVLNRLHAWNGENWVPISAEDYINGAFFENPPAHAILIEPENTPAPKALIPDGTWCTRGNRLRSTEPPVMLHLLGNYFDFSYLMWKQCSRRYNQPIARINPSLLNMRWWNTYGEDLWKKGDRLNPQQDQDQWRALDITPPSPIEPVQIKDEPVVTPAEIPASHSTGQPQTNREPSILPEVEAIFYKLKSSAPPSPNPFSGEEIPAAEIILPPAE